MHGNLKHFTQTIANKYY